MAALINMIFFIVTLIENAFFHLTPYLYWVKESFRLNSNQAINQIIRNGIILQPEYLVISFCEKKRFSLVFIDLASSDISTIILFAEKSAKKSSASKLCDLGSYLHDGKIRHDKTDDDQYCDEDVFPPFIDILIPYILGTCSNIPQGQGNDRE